MKRSEYTRRYYLKEGEKVRAGHREWWHKAGGGYVQRRRRELAQQRAAVQSRLRVIEQEASELVT